jgi:site-specific recombinase
MHATESATWWYAASTGVILWSASLLAGSIENWSAYRRVPRAIAEHPLGARVGRERMQRLAHDFARNVSAYAGSVVLGFFLGIAPAIGTFTGLPIDVRHVTLSTGQVAFAACALGTAFDARVGFALGGVALMFVLNLSVSFALALWVAMRARGVGRGERRALLVAVLRRLRRRPLEFVVPLHRPTPAGGA